MKFISKHFIIATLAFALTTALVLNISAKPVYAQAVDGSLIDIGQGDSRILTSGYQPLSTGQQVTYQFAYDGNGDPISVSLTSIPAGGANFQIWTSERLEALQTSPDTQPLGQGTSPTSDTSVTTWQGGSTEAETYYVVVSLTGDAAASYLLSVSSLGLSAAQPGAVASTAITSTTAISPTTPVDPNIATVTTDALNVRSGPSTAFPVLVTIPNGTQMTVLGRNPANTWINVQMADGTEGWVTRSLTSYTLVSPNVILPSALPGAAATIAATLTATATAPVTATASVTTTNAVSVTELGDNWQTISTGGTDWYSFQYRGGSLPLTIWMDLDPFDQAQFTVVSAETFAAITNGTATTPVPVVGSGITNPVQPGYLFWQANFPEADTYYIMVTPTAAAGGNVLYSISALGPGVARGIEPVP